MGDRPHDVETMAPQITELAIEDRDRVLASLQSGRDRVVMQTDLVTERGNTIQDTQHVPGRGAALSLSVVPVSMEDVVRRAIASFSLPFGEEDGVFQVIVHV